MRVFTDARCLRHEVPAGFPEVPARLERILERLGRERGSEILDAARSVPEEELLALARQVHEPEYVERFRRAVSRGDGLLDSADNPLSPGSWAAALGAAAATVAAVDDVLAAGEPAFAAIRPPGHHAERASAMGFCYLNNAAIAVERSIRGLGLRRVAVVDFDVHHGNGTQHLFEERPDVLYASIHQWPFYPGTGSEEERGRGAGAGATLNVPLAAGSGDEQWRQAMDQRVIPAVDRFEPELLVVSAGFDAWRADPLGGMRVTEAGFAGLGASLAAAARRSCSGRLLGVLEGGYDLSALPELVRGFLDSMRVR